MALPTQGATRSTPPADIETYSLARVGTIHTVFPTCFGCPRQGLVAPSARGRLELAPWLVAAGGSDGGSGSAYLEGLESFSHCWVLFVFDQNRHSSASFDPAASFLNPTVRPPWLTDEAGRKRGSSGVFATRTPHRPNPIGQTVCRIDGVDRARNAVYLSGVDIIDGTAVLDFKPYHPVDAAPVVGLPERSSDVGTNGRWIAQPNAENDWHLGESSGASSGCAVSARDCGGRASSSHGASDKTNNTGASFEFDLQYTEDWQDRFGTVFEEKVQDIDEDDFDEALLAIMDRTWVQLKFDLSGANLPILSKERFPLIVQYNMKDALADGNRVSSSSFAVGDAFFPSWLPAPLPSAEVRWHAAAEAELATLQPACAFYPDGRDALVDGHADETVAISGCSPAASAAIATARLRRAISEVLALDPRTPQSRVAKGEGATTHRYWAIYFDALSVVFRLAGASGRGKANEGEGEASSPSDAAAQVAFEVVRIERRDFAEGRSSKAWLEALRAELEASDGSTHACDL